MDDSASNVLWFWGWSSWRLWGLIPAEFLYFWVLQMAWFPFKCLRNASIYRSLEVGERHVAESDWWHISQPDWSTYTCWTVCVIAYTRWTACVNCLCHRLHVLMCDWFLHDTWQISVGFGIVIAKPSCNTWCFVIGCILWTW